MKRSLESGYIFKEKGFTDSVFLSSFDPGFSVA